MTTADTATIRPHGNGHLGETAECRVCGCTEDDPCPTGHISAYSCLPVPDPQGSPRLCHFHGDEAAQRCDVVSIGLLTLGKPERCAMAATHRAQYRCERGHLRDLRICRLHATPDDGIPSDCAACDGEGQREVPVRLVESTLLYPHTRDEATA